MLNFNIKWEKTQQTSNNDAIKKLRRLIKNAPRYSWVATLDS